MLAEMESMCGSREPVLDEAVCTSASVREIGLMHLDLVQRLHFAFSTILRFPQPARSPVNL